MRTHITVLAWIHIVLNSLSLLGGLIVFLFFGGIGAFAASSGRHDDLAALPILGGVGMFVFLFILILSLPGLLTGIGLLNYAPWARILGIILAIISLPLFPVGTALGVYGLIVLFNNETVALFERPQYRNY